MLKITDKDKKAVEKQIKKPRQHLIDQEVDNLKVFHQKKPGGLYVNFRDDASFFALQQFSTYGLTLDKLLKFQEKTPAVYAWNIDYHNLRYNVNRRFNVFPLIIVMAKTEDDVVEAFNFSQKYNLKIVPRGGSHCFEDLSLTTGMIIDQSRRKKIKVNTRKKTVEVEAGTLLGPLLDVLYKDKLMLPVGLCANNCVAGFSLGGGLGLFARAHGTTADNMLSTKILTADGKTKCLDDNNHEDLFWAIRGGGGGNFGIHLNFKFKVYDIDKIYVFYLKYSYDKIKTIINLWQDLYDSFPEDLTIDIRCVADKNMVGVSGVYRGNCREYLDLLLAPFKNIETTSVFIEKQSYIDSVKYFGGDGRWQQFFKIKTGFIKDKLPPKALDIIASYMTKGFNTYNISIKSLGGKNNEIPSDAIAFPHRGVKAWFLIDAQWSSEDQAKTSLEWCKNFYDEIQPYLGEGVYINAPDKDLDNYLRKYYLDNLDRLVEIKNKYDPNNIFNNSQSILTKL